MKQLVIYGAGGFGREVAQLVRDINHVERTWELSGFLTDDAAAVGTEVGGLPVLGSLNWLTANPHAEVVIAVGNSAIRRKLAAAICSQGTTAFATLIHPRAWVGDQVTIGNGSIICAGALITTDITLGEHVHVNIGATIGHDAVLEDYVTLNPGVSVSGNAVLRQGGQIGTGSVIIPSCEVGAWSVIGAGAVVTKSIGANVTAVGAPAKPIKEQPTGWQSLV